MQLKYAIITNGEFLMAIGLSQGDSVCVRARWYTIYQLSLLIYVVFNCIYNVMYIYAHI